jgi:hypothetical protein
MPGPYSPLDVNGEVPDLAGQRCEAFLARAHWHKGELNDPANTSHLCFDGRWHRLYFDHGFVFWREDEGRPEPAGEPEGDFAWTVEDVGAAAGVIGATLIDFDMTWEEAAAVVVFTFVGGASITFTNDYATDTTRWSAQPA